MQLPPPPPPPPPPHATEVGVSLLVARQAPPQLPRECLHAEAAAAGNGWVCWGSMVPIEKWRGEEPDDKFKAAVSPPTRSNGGESEGEGALCVYGEGLYMRDVDTR